jgi:CBS domain-containing protein
VAAAGLVNRALPGEREFPVKVADIMRRDLKTIAPGATVAEAVELMSEFHITGLPVIDRHGRLIGVVSTTDVLDATAEAATPEERELVFESTSIDDIMTPRPATVLPETDVMEAARHMLYLEVHRLFVEDAGHLAGVISQSDIVAAVATAKL